MNFDQVRPDRRTVRGHLHACRCPATRSTLFRRVTPMHVGAVASAASVLPPGKRNLVWAIGTVLVSTRVLLLAHWASDVIIGLAMGVTVERVMRRLTGFGKATSG
jgi:hypothetical protein